MFERDARKINSSPVQGVPPHSLWSRIDSPYHSRRADVDYILVGAEWNEQINLLGVGRYFLHLFSITRTLACRWKCDTSSTIRHQVVAHFLGCSTKRFLVTGVLKARWCHQYTYLMEYMLIENRNSANDNYTFMSCESDSSAPLCSRSGCCATRL